LKISNFENYISEGHGAGITEANLKNAAKKLNIRLVKAAPEMRFFEVDPYSLRGIFM